MDLAGDLGEDLALPHLSNSSTCITSCVDSYAYICSRGLSLALGAHPEDHGDDASPAPHVLPGAAAERRRLPAGAESLQLGPPEAPAAAASAAHSAPCGAPREPRAGLTALARAAAAAAATAHRAAGAAGARGGGAI